MPERKRTFVESVVELERRVRRLEDKVSRQLPENYILKYDAAGLSGPGLYVQNLDSGVATYIGP
jgi:hypothetical protein